MFLAAVEGRQAPTGRDGGRLRTLGDATGGDVRFRCQRQRHRYPAESRLSQPVVAARATSTVAAARVEGESRPTSAGETTRGLHA